MTTATSKIKPAERAEVKNKPAWQAELTWEQRYYTTEEKAPTGEVEETVAGGSAETPETGTVEEWHSVMDCFVRVSRPGCEGISFLVNHREGRDVTFTDPRGRDTGIAGVTGIWGTLPAPPVHKPRPLSRASFQIELARLVGAERAEEIVRTILSPNFFGLVNDKCKTSGVAPVHQDSCYPTTGRTAP